MAELGYSELGDLELGAGEDSPSPVNLVLSFAATTSFSTQLNGTNLVFSVGSTISMSMVLTVAVPLQLGFAAQSSMSLGSINPATYITMPIAAVSSMSMFLTIERFIDIPIAAVSSMSLALSGGSPSIELSLAMAAQSEMSLVLVSEITGAFSWTGESSVLIHAEVLEIQIGEFNWTGEGHVSIMAGFTPTGSTAEQAIHIAESTGGVWTATFGGDTTGSLAYNISASALQTALESLPSIGSGNVAVTGGPGGVQPFSVRFIGALFETPVGLITVDDSGLTGPTGLHPHVGTISLSPGYSAEDDYGTVDDIAIKVENDYKHYEFKGIQIGLKLTESDIGGDEEASWSSQFTGPYDLPRVNSKVLISDLRGGFWAGLLEQPKYKIRNDSMDVDFTAHGHFVVAHDLPYRMKRLWLQGVLARQLWSEARNELSDGRIAITDDFLASGKALVNDTPDHYNSYLADLLDTYTALGDYDDVPLTYGVRLPLIPGYYPDDPILYVEREASTVSLIVSLADGAEVDSEIDGSQIVNRYYVPWKIPDDPLEREGLALVDHPTSASEVGRLRAQVAGQTFPSEADAIAYGNLLVNRHGSYRSAGASLVIPGGVPVFTPTRHVFPHWRIRPNQLFSVPDLPDVSEGLPPIDLRSSKFSWDQETDQVSITTGYLGDLKRVFRQLVKAPNQLEQQPNEPDDHTIHQSIDTSSKSRPWQGNDPRSANPTIHEPGVVPAENTAAAARTITLHFVIPKDDPPLPCRVDFDCILRGITIYGPIGQDGTAHIIAGHSTYENYGTITNLTSLEMSGNPGKATDMKVRQQIFASDSVYVAFPTPMTGYTHIIVALTCERAW